LENIAKLIKLERLYVRKYGQTPSDEELAEFGLDIEFKTVSGKVISLQDIQKLRSCIHDQAGLSIDRPSSDGEGFSLLDIIPDTSSLSATDQLAIDHDNRQMINTILNTLTSREVRVLLLRNGIGPHNEHTLNQVGERFNLTRERIRQIEGQAIMKLQRALTNYKCGQLKPSATDIDFFADDALGEENEVDTQQPSNTDHLEI